MKQSKRQKQQEKLEDLIRDLERDISEGKSQVAGLEEAYKRLEESERLCQELANENRRLGAEITRWQERSARNEQDERQVSSLQRQLKTLQAEHAKAIEKNRKLEEKLTANAQGRVSPGVPSSANAIGRDRTGAWRTYALRATQIGRAWLRENRRVAVGFAGMVILMMISAVLIFQKQEPGPSKLAAAFPPDDAKAVERVAEPKAKPEVKPAVQTPRRILGVFQTIRPTRVYSAPSEDAEPVADLGTGTRVNVVGSRDGWLEVRSKHGRPPGFVRQEATERVRSN